MWSPARPIMAQARGRPHRAAHTRRRGPGHAQSELSFQAELHDPSRPGGHDLAEVGRTEECAHAVEIGVVESIEGFGTKLEFSPFAECEGLEQRKVPVVNARPSHNVSPGVAEETGCRRFEGCRVKPLLHGL